MRRIAATGMVPTTATGVYDAPSPREIVDAQKLLLASGYYLADTAMVEGDFYLLRFIHVDGDWPGWIKLRYTTNGIQVPPLALMYREGTEVRQFIDGGHRATFGTGTSDAEKMVFAWEQLHGDQPYFWMPVFDGTPFAQY